MKDEIKEMNLSEMLFNRDEQLLDYITNLQEENKKVHKELDYADNYNIYLISKIDKAIEYIYHWSTQRKKFFDKIDRQLNGKPQFYGDVADLLNILQGEDKDE